MKTQPVPDPFLEYQPPYARAGAFKTLGACVAGICIPGLGHALLAKWDRALVFFASILILFGLGLQLHGRLFGPDFESFFAVLKFMAQAGSGLLYWVSLLGGSGAGDPTAFTYDYANTYIYVAGLLNMLVVVDAFDIAMGRKR